MFYTPEKDNEHYSRTKRRKMRDDGDDDAHNSDVHSSSITSLNSILLKTQSIRLEYNDSLPIQFENNQYELTWNFRYIGIEKSCGSNILVVHPLLHKSIKYYSGNPKKLKGCWI